MKLFTNARTINKKPLMQMDMTPIVQVRTYATPAKKLSQQIRPTAPPTEVKHGVPRVMWGPAIWYFLHTISEKVIDESFNSIREELIQHILAVCSNLPCPECSNHAMMYMRNIDTSKIRTPEDLRQMLFIFHNDVNKRLGKPQFSYVECQQKYKNANLNNVLTLFFKYFEDSHKTVNMLSNDMFTKRLSRLLKEWLRSNILCFDFN